MKKSIYLALAVISAFAISVGCANQPKADRTVYVNGKICTMNDGAMWAEAVVIEDGKFLFVGTMEELAQSGYDDKTGKKVDLGGKFVMPGIIDAHQHIGLTVLYGGKWGNESPYIITDTKEEALDSIKKFIDEHPDYDKYKVSAGYKEKWGGRLNIHDLDGICPDKPLCVSDGGGHSATINTRLKEAMGFTDDTPDPVPGFCYYGRDKDGKMDGILYEHVVWKVYEYLDTYPHDKIAPGIEYILNYNTEHGITGAYDAGVLYREDEVSKVFREMDDNGKVNLRLNISHTIFLPEMVDDAIRLQLRLKEEYEGGNITINTLKVFMDGTASEYSGFVKDPYEGTNRCGGCLFTEDEMCKFFSEANDNNVDIHLHTIGDAAAERIANVVERIVNEQGDFSSHVTMAHCELVTNETLEKIRKYGLYMDMTPSWLDGPEAGSFYFNDVYKLTDENKKRAYLLKTNLQYAGNMTLSSDCPVYPEVKEYMWNPYYGMEMAITRYGIGQTGPDEGCCGGVPEERLTIDEVLKCYTINGAIQLGWQDECGSIEEGKSADMVVLDRNLFEIPATDIHNATPELVLFKGKVLVQK